VLSAASSRFILASGRARLGDVLEHLARIHGERDMISEHRSGRVISYRAASELTQRWSASVAARSQPGEPVVIAMPNGVDQFLMCLAVARAGRIPAPVNDQMRAAEIDHVVADAGASLVIRSVRSLRGSAPPIESSTPQASDVAALFYTSGTTGKPKGVALTHRSLLASAPAAMAPTWLRSDEVVAALPVAHIMGFATYLSLALSGVRTYSLEVFDAVEVLEVIETRRPTGFIGVPSMYRKLAEVGAASRHLRSIRFWGSGADVMPTELVDLFKSFGATAHLPLVGDVGQAAFVEGYGMVEVGGGVAASMSLPFVPASLSAGVGITLPGYRTRVVDPAGRAVRVGSVGELLVKGPGVLAGYWGAPEATAQVLDADGWLSTGDLVRRGPAGVFTFQGRAKQVIKTGGFTVYPLEVEAALEEHPDVLQAAVVGIPSATKGQVPAAAIRLRPGARATAADVEAWVGERLSRYKTPRRIVVVDELASGGTGKVQKDHLLELFA